jgi:hypothetical protein
MTRLCKILSLVLVEERAKRVLRSGYVAACVAAYGLALFYIERMRK